MESRLYNRKSGKWEILPEDKTTEAVASGEYAFAQGLRIPVIAPDGTRGSIPAEQAEAAFRDDGFKWATDAESKAYEQQKNEQILDKHFGDETGTAMLAGAARGATFGLSDMAIRALGGEGAAEAAKEIRARNKTASTIGEIGGGLATSFVGPGAAALKGLGSLTAGAKISSGVGRAALTAGAEGALFGAGEGITQSFIGNPQEEIFNNPAEIAKNMLVHGAMGGVFGGMFGATFKLGQDAAPWLKERAKQTFDAGAELANKTARGMTKGIVTPVLKKADKEAFKKAVNASDVRDKAFSKGLLKDYDEVIKQADGMRTSANRVINENKAILKKSLKNLQQKTKETDTEIYKQFKNEIEEMARQNADDILKMKHDVYKKSQQAYQQVDELASKLSGEAPKYTKDIAKNFDDFHKALKQHGVDSHYKVDINAGRAYLKRLEKEGLSATDEVVFLNGMKRKLGKDLYAARRTGSMTPGDLAKQELYQKIDQQLLKHSNKEISNAYSNANKYYTVYSDITNQTEKKIYSDLSDFYKVRGLSKEAKAKLKDTYKVDKKIVKNFTDPEYMDRLDFYLSNVDEAVAATGAFREKLANQKDAVKAYNEMVEQFAANNKSMKYDLSDLQDMDRLLKDMGVKGDLRNQYDKVAQFSKEMSEIGPQTSPLVKYIKFKKILGEDISKELDTLNVLQNHEQMFNTIKQLGADKIKSEDLWRDFAIGTVASAVIPWAPVVGAARAGAAIRKDPTLALRGLTLIENLNRSGAKRATNMVNRAVKTLTSPTAKALGTVAAGQGGGKSVPLEKARKYYKKNKKTLEDLADPEKMANYLDDRMPPITEAPMVQAHMNMKLMEIHSYLYEQMPKNPNETGMPFIDDKWEPSDQELARFHRKVQTVEDPAQAIENMANGTITVEEIDTMRAIYPDILQNVQTQILEQLNTKKPNLNYDQRNVLNELFEIPLDTSLQPDFIYTMQENFVIKDKGGRPPKTSGKVDIEPKNVSTNISRITEK